MRTTRPATLMPAAAALALLPFFARAAAPSDLLDDKPPVISSDGVSRLDITGQEAVRKGKTDDYWSWRIAFVAASSTNQAAVAAHRTELDGLRIRTTALRREQLRLMRMLEEEKQKRILTWSEWLQGKLGLYVPPVQWGPAAIRRCEERIQQIPGEIAALRNEQLGIIGGCDKLFDGLVGTLRESATIYAHRAGEKERIEEAMAGMEDRKRVEKLNLLETAGLWQEAREAIAAFLQADPKMDPEARDLLEAKRLLAAAREAEGQMQAAALLPPEHSAYESVARAHEEALASAYLLLRPLVDKDRGRPPAERNHEARLLLQQEEERCLGMVARKLEQEKQATIAGFETYLSKRGFSPKDPSGWSDAAWDWINGVFCCGPITLMGGSSLRIPYTDYVVLEVANAPAAIADLASTEQEEIAKFNVSLLAATRLVRLGCSLSEILAMNSDALAEKLVAGRSDLKPLPPEKKHQLASDIHATFRGLPDLNALASGDSRGFYEQYKRPYYERECMDQSWSEWCGDLFSLRHILLLWAPGGLVCKVNGVSTLGRAGFIGRAALSEADALGQAVRAQDLVVQAIAGSARWQALCGAPGIGKVIGSMSRVAVQDQAFLDALRGGAYAGRIAGRLAAMMFLYTAGPYALENLDMPNAAILFRMMVELNAGSILHDVLARTGMPMQKLMRAVTETEQMLARGERQLDDLARRVNDMDAAIRAQRGAAPPGPRVARPGGTVRTSPENYHSAPATLDEAFGACERALQDGNVDEAASAYAAAQRLLEQQQLLLRNQREILEAAKRQIQESFARPSTPVQETFESLLAKIKNREAIPPFLDDTAAKCLDVIPLGPQLMEADALLREGNIPAAIEKYRNAARNAEIFTWPAKFDPALQPELQALLRRRIALAETRALAVQQLAKLRNGPALKAGEELAADEAGRVCQKLEELVQGGHVAPQILEGLHAPVRLRTPDGQTWIIKAADDSNAAAAGFDLCRELGVAAPAARTVMVSPKVLGQTGDAPRQAILMRFVPGKAVAACTEPEIQAHAAELARLRVLRAWLGDSDAHLENAMHGADGRLWGLDLPAMLRDNRIALDNVDEKGNLLSYAFERVASPATENGAYVHVREYMRDLFTMPYRRPWSAHSKYQAAARIDEMLPRAEMRAAAAAIDDLCSNNPTRLAAILKGHLPEADVPRAMELLKERAKVLAETLDEVFPGKLTPADYAGRMAKVIENGRRTQSVHTPATPGRGASARPDAQGRTWVVGDENSPNGVWFTDSTIFVKRGDRIQEFSRTNRSLDQNIDRGFLLRDGAADPGGVKLSLDELKGKRVLDLASGTDAVTVADLRRAGVAADGMDIALAPGRAGEGLRQADITDGVPFSQGTYDVVYEFFGGLSYGLGDASPKALQNAVSAVKPGGFVYLVPVDEKALNAMQPALDKLRSEGYRVVQGDYGHGDSILRIVKPAP